MSKSKGNVIDPLDLIATYGTDALRFTVCALTGPGRDVKLGPSPRRILPQLRHQALERRPLLRDERRGAPNPAFRPGRRPIPALPLGAGRREPAPSPRPPRRSRPTASTNTPPSSYQLHVGTRCATGSWSSPNPSSTALMARPRQEIRATAAHVLGIVLRLLHPAMPFVTEHLWDQLGYGARLQSLIRATMARRGNGRPGPTRRGAELDWVVRKLISARPHRPLRDARGRPPSPHPDPAAGRLAHDHGPLPSRTGTRRWARMGRASERPERMDGPMPAGSAQVVVDEATVVLPLAGVIDFDLDVERARLEKDRWHRAGGRGREGPQASSPTPISCRAPSRMWWTRTANACPRMRPRPPALPPPSPGSTRLPERERSRIAGRALMLTKRWDKSRLPSRHVTEGPGSRAAPQLLLRDGPDRGRDQPALRRRRHLLERGRALQHRPEPSGAVA